MDTWQIAQNYIVAAAIAGTVGGYYYYTSNQRKPNRTGSSGGLNTKRSESDLRVRHQSREGEDLEIRQTPRPENNGALKKRKPNKPESRTKKEVKEEKIVDAARDEKPAKESDISTAAFAQQMLQARQGANLTSSKHKEARVKTVKPRILPATSSAASAVETGTDADDEEAHDAGDVSDMLPARAAGPSTLRITASEKPQTQRAVRQPKQEVVESKKQRQNRKKNEARKAAQEADERERRTFEERQRRTAREARGEPAKNGIARPPPPTSNPWEQRNANNAATVQSAMPNTQLLDTFDVESTSSSNGGLDASTAATSTTEGEQAHLSEEDQMAAALKQSGDESGWTTVAAPKKTKKQPSNVDIAAASSQNSSQVKSGGFAALDISSNDANDWDA